MDPGLRRDDGGGEANGCHTLSVMAAEAAIHARCGAHWLMSGEIFQRLRMNFSAVESVA
jgi:hypothetical protein